MQRKGQSATCRGCSNEKDGVGEVMMIVVVDSAFSVLSSAAEKSRNKRSGRKNIGWGGRRY